MINEKYNDLLIAIAELIAAKNDRIDTLHEEINELKAKLSEAEQNVLRALTQKGN